MDITYIPMARGFVYLAAVLDWASRRVLSWRLSITMEAGFCVEALEDALAKHCNPEIFNTDQGCQFTSRDWTGSLEDLGVRVSMDGKGRWMDNVFIERLWRSLKCEDIYLRDYRNLAQLEAGVRRWMAGYNRERIHEALGYATPWSIYRPQPALAEAA